MFNYEDVLEKTKLILATRGNKKSKELLREAKIQKEKEAGDLRLDLKNFTTRESLLELKTELAQSPQELVDSFYAVNPEIYSAIKSLSSNKTKKTPNTLAKCVDVEYYSVITGKKNTYLYSGVMPDSDRVEDKMSLATALQKLKQHHQDLLTEWRTPVVKFIIPKSSMIELNWYPSADKTLTEQFNEYRDIFITPERQRRETVAKEIELELKWFADQYSKRKKYCSTVRWRNKNIYNMKRLRRRCKKMWKYWRLLCLYSLKNKTCG